MTTKADVLEWMHERTGFTANPETTNFLAYAPNGKIEACIIFAHYSGNDIELTAASDSRFPRHLLKAAFTYVVEQCGCDRITFKTPPDNLKAIACNERLGAVLEGRQRDFYGPGKDALVFGLLRKDFPYGK